MMDPVNANEIYQSLLKNEDGFMQLQKLVLQAEEFHAKNSDYDIIKEYMQLSGNCQELIPYIKELSTCDSHYAMSLLNAVCHIFIRLASDLHMFIAAGTSIVNDILSYGMKTIYNFLKMKQKASRTKSALHLLTSMIALGNPIALQVVSKLNFSNPEFSRLLNRTNFSEDEDVRTAFLNLIVLIITVSNNNTIRQIVEVKGFLNSILPGLISDRVSTIILVLNAFRQHIIENSNIPKTTKLRLFNDYTLKSVIQLYSWKGPIRTKKHGKRKLGEDQYTVAYEVSEEEIAEVRSCAHEFMLALCCSTKNGIIFADLSCGTSAKNYNNVITNILKSIPKPYSEPLMSELVVSILKACPDQIQLYLPIFKDNFVPRISMSWLKAVDFLKQVIKSQNSVSILFKMQIKRPVMTLVSIAKSFCFLDLLRISDFSEIFMNGHRILCIYLCNFLLCILSQVKTILDFCNHPDVIDMPYDSFEISNFKLTFLSLVFPCLPDVNKLQRYWEKITSEPIEASEDVALKDILLPTFAEELLTLIDVLKIYKTLANELHKEFDLDLLQMLNDLKICNIHVPWSDLSKIYITLMDLLSEQYSVSLWKKHQPSESPLMLVLDVYLAAHKSKETFMARDIVYKILIQTQIFDHCEWEIDIWLDSIEYVKSRHIPFVFELISEAIRVLLMQSNSIADVKNMSKVKNENVESNETDENEIICLQPDEKQKFSNFTAAVFDCLLSLEENKKKSVQIFVQKSIRHLMHHQYSARSFLAAVENYRTLIDPDLFAYWQFLTLSPDIKICIENTCTGNSLCSLDFSEHLGQNFISSHSKVVKSISCNINELFDNLDGKSIRKALWQVLMYIDFEIKTTLKDGTDDAIISTYIKLLDKLLSSLPILATKDVMDIDCNDEVIKVENDSISPAMPVVEIVKDFLNHPIVLKLFLFYTKILKKVLIV